MTLDQKKLSSVGWFFLGLLILSFPIAAVVYKLFFAVQKPLIYSDTQGVVFENHSSDVLDNLTFGLDEWDPSLLKIVDVGSRILPSDTVFDIAPPPANSSPETKMDLDALRSFAKNERTPSEVEIINLENTYESVSDAFEAAGYFDSANNRKAKAILEKADEDLAYFIMRAKKQFSRPRPSKLASDLELIFDNPKHPAYPSGHATQGYMVALILGYLDPEYSEKYKELGVAIGHRREIAGVHYPSDSVAGRKLAQDVFNKLLEVTEFRTELDEAKASFVRAKRLEQK